MLKKNFKNFWKEKNGNNYYRYVLFLKLFRYFLQWYTFEFWRSFMMMMSFFRIQMFRIWRRTYTTWRRPCTRRSWRNHCTWNNSHGLLCTKQQKNESKHKQNLLRAHYTTPEKHPHYCNAENLWRKKLHIHYY